MSKKGVLSIALVGGLIVGAIRGCPALVDMNYHAHDEVCMDVTSSKRNLVDLLEEIKPGYDSITLTPTDTAYVYTYAHDMDFIFYSYLSLNGRPLPLPLQKGHTSLGEDYMHYRLYELPACEFTPGKNILMYEMHDQQGNLERKEITVFLRE